MNARPLVRPIAVAAARVPLGRGLRLLWWLVAGFSLWLRSGFAVYALGDAGLDDALFVRLARYLGAGLWLGPFDNTTLVKGMFYPLFILISFAAGIPLKLAEQGVYLAASAGVSLLLARSPRGRWLATALFVALALNPVLWTVELARVIREGLYVGLSLGLVGLAASVALSPSPARPGGLLRGLAFGLVGGAFWLTREEGVWLLPALATVLVLGWAALPGRVARAVPMAVAAAGAMAVVGGVALMNQRVYGVAETVEVKSAAFEQAYGALARIEPRQWRRFVVFPADARALAYQVSPAARELAPTLDGEPARRWVAIGCASAPMPDCTEVQASWFQWMFRDAVKDAGHYSSAPEAARYYRQLAGEINDACDRHAIPCGPPRASLAPPFRGQYLHDALAPARGLFAILLHPGAIPLDFRPSEGSAVAIDLFAETAGPVRRGLRPWLIIDALIGSPLGAPALAVRPPEGTPVHSETLLDPAADSGAPFPLTHIRFITDCPADRCDLLLQAGDRLVPLGRLDALPATVRTTDAYADIHTVTHIGGQGQDRRSALIGAVALRIGGVYAVATPILAATGALGLALTLVLRRRAALASPAFVLALASLVAVLCRVALLAYLDVTAIASENVLYASPASPFVIVFAVLGSALLVATLLGARR